MCTIGKTIVMYESLRLRWATIKAGIIKYRLNLFQSIQLTSKKIYSDIKTTFLKIN